MKDYSGKKLCALAKKEIPQKDPKGYAALVVGGQYFCEKCGRVAVDKETLCSGKKGKIKSKKK
jgi:hypothetical protein